MYALAFRDAAEQKIVQLKWGSERGFRLSSLCSKASGVSLYFLMPTQILMFRVHLSCLPSTKERAGELF